VTLTVDTRPVGDTIPADFAGLSFETMTLLPDRAGGHLFSPTNTPLIALFRNLGLKSLRIGGATVDTASVRIPARADIDQLFRFARAAGVKVIYSLRLLNGNPQADAALAQYIWSHYRHQLGSFAIGNEPDWNYYHRRDPRIHDFFSYLADWQRFAAMLKREVPRARLSGPDTGGNIPDGSPDNGPGPAWTVQFALAERQAIAFATQHDYVGQRPGGLSAPQAIAAMLSPGWNTSSNRALLAAMAQPLLRAGLSYRFTEANEFIGGVPNASDTFAAAPWALDFLHGWAAHGAAGVNLHNKRWLSTDTIRPDSAGNLVALPRAYAIKAFELGSRGQVLRLAIGNPNQLNLTGYAVRHGNQLFVTIMNKEHGSQARTAAVTIVPQGLVLSSAAVLLLAAPDNDVNAAGGITLGGAPITNNSPWRGRWTPLRPGSSGELKLNINAASAAIICFRR
jgi:hypothetical protein